MLRWSLLACRGPLCMGFACIGCVCVWETCPGEGPGADEEWLVAQARSGARAMPSSAVPLRPAQARGAALSCLCFKLAATTNVQVFSSSSALFEAAPGFLPSSCQKQCHSKRQGNHQSFLYVSQLCMRQPAMAYPALNTPKIAHTGYHPTFCCSRR